MIRKTASLLLVTAFLLLGSPARAAVFGIAPFPRNGEKATMDDWLDALKTINDAGAKGMVITKTWNDLEPAQETYDVTQLVKDFNSNAGDGHEVLFGLQVINTVARETPADLQLKPWNDRDVVTRFRELIDALAKSSPKPPKYISLGNEADIYLQQHPDEISAYIDFYKQAAAIVREKFPQAKIGITVTYEGLVKDRRDIIQKLVALSDVAIFTYYPLIDLKIQPVTATGRSLDALITVAQGKPVVMQEVGFPSSAKLDSSETMQADFFARVITEIKNRPQIAFASLFMLHDFSPMLCEGFVGYYGLNGASDEARQRFREFLCTLGLKTFDGKEKAAWGKVKDGLKERRFWPF